MESRKSLRAYIVGLEEDMRKVKNMRSVARTLEYDVEVGGTYYADKFFMLISEYEAEIETQVLLFLSRYGEVYSEK